MDFTEYLKAKKLGDKQFQKDVNAGKYPYLPALDDLIGKQSDLSQISIGLAEIPLFMITGTKTHGRQNSFASNYMPIMDADTEFAGKWVRLYDAQMNEGIHDAVKVYEYMKKFYVQEGNKRVSVMKYLEMPSASADVIRIMPERSDDPEVRLYYEFCEFYRVCPIYEISFSRPGSYERFAEVLGKDLKQKWSSDFVHTVEAAYYRFSKIYKELGGDKLKIQTGDAFLVFLNIYTLKSLLDLSHGILEERIKRLWGEMKASVNRTSPLREAPLVQQSGTGLFSLLKRPPVYNETHPLKAAFIFDDNPDHSGMINDQEIARIYLENTFDGIVKTKPYYDCSDGSRTTAALMDACAWGGDVVFTISPAMLNDTLRAAAHYPDVRFLNCSMNFSHKSVRLYYARMWEAKFLMGAIAASQAENHKVGYLAGYPIYGHIASINAYAIGAAVVDPEIKVYLDWSTLKNNNWRERFLQNDVKVISSLDTAIPFLDDTEYGLVKKEGNTLINLAAPVWNWGRYYELIIKTILNGTYDDDPLAQGDSGVNYWYGLREGVVDVSLSENLPYYTRKLVKMLRESLLAGTLSPFMGELHSQTEMIQPAGADMLSNDKIIEMDWLNDNIIGRFPAMDELREAIQKIVKASGVSFIKERSGEQ